MADVVSAEAIIVPAREANLSFKTGGQVLQVLVSEGDFVTAGQELVKMNTRDLEQVVRRAEAELKSAEAEAAKAKTGSRAEEIAAAEAALGVAQAGVKAAEKAVEVSQGNLAAVQAHVKTAGSGVEIAQGKLAEVQAAVQNAQANLNKLVAGPTPREIQIAEVQLEQAKNALWGLQRQREFSSSIKQGTIDAAETAVKIAQLQLDRLKAGSRVEDIAIARSQVAEAVAAVQTAQGQLTQAQSQEAQAKARILAAEGQVAQAKSEVESARAQVQQRQAQLDALKAGTRSEDIAVAEAAVSRATAALTEARNGLADAILKAPFDGTVGALLVNEGEQAMPQTPVLTLGDLSRWRVQTEDLAEVDVSRVAVGQDVTVTVDALTGEKFKGKVTEVASIANDRRGDKVYMVTADLDSAGRPGLRWGMSAFLETRPR
jgi:HlyD family secretion protein